MRDGHCDDCGTRNHRDRTRPRGAVAHRRAHARWLSRRRRRRARRPARTSISTRRSSSSERGCPPELAVRILADLTVGSRSRAQCVLVTALLAYIPSPSSGSFQTRVALHDPHVRRDAADRHRRLHLADRRRWVRWGGDWDLVFRMSLWGVIAGIIGARLYHDITSWNQDPTIHAHWYGFAAVWDGGLGIWGAIPIGLIAGALVVRHSGNSVRLMMDAVAPGLLLAQGIGRWGNYWNQELYGKPTSLPWGLRIDQAHQTGHRPAVPVDGAVRLLPADLPLRVHLGHARRRRSSLDRPALHDQAARALRALRRVVHDVPHVRGDPADRPVEPLPRHAGQLLGLARRLDRRGRASSSGGSSSSESRRSPSRSRSRGRSRPARRWLSRRAASGSAVTVSAA